MPADFQLPEILCPSAMEKYVSAIQKMEQTVMFPSLLREVSLEDDFGADKDLFEHFMLLKSGKGMLESSRALSTREETLPVVPEAKEKIDKESLEDNFYYHLSSLYRILHHLTQRAQAVTAKYNEIMERMNRS
ncbi:thyroid hormone-inducible hepatic protein-like [Erythrolamprus reginae]|uniref:thyroid hormone-inducible hepatic protein-like n=1 Tax=Erythrolamprus reginae TaxID=121349 RepID=UPI00396CF6EC